MSHEDTVIFPDVHTHILSSGRRPSHLLPFTQWVYCVVGSFETAPALAPESGGDFFVDAVQDPFSDLVDVETQSRLIADAMGEQTDNSGNRLGVNYWTSSLRTWEFCICVGSGRSSRL